MKCHWRPKPQPRWWWLVDAALLATLWTCVWAALHYLVEVFFGG